MANTDFADESVTPGAVGDKFVVIRGADSLPGSWTEALVNIDSLIGGGASLASLAVVAATSISPGASFLSVAGYALPGDSFTHVFKRVATEPSHEGKVRSLDRFLPNGTTDADDGGWWELTGNVVDVRIFGAVGDGATICDDAFNNASLYLVDVGGGELLIPTGTYVIETRVWARSNVTWRGIGEKPVLIAESGSDVTVLGNPNGAAETVAPWTYIENFNVYDVIFDGNKANAPAVAARSVTTFDPMKSCRFEGVIFRNALGYGVALQYPPATSVPHNDRVVDLTFIKCGFENNGDGIGGDTYDGIDVKNCKGIKFFDCWANDNINDGFDFRGEDVLLVGCNASGNGGSGVSITANTNGTTQNSSIQIIGGRYNSNNDGMIIANGSGSGTTQVDICGAEFSSNTDNGINADHTNTNSHIRIASASIRDNGGHGIDADNATEQFDINAHIEGNGGDGIWSNATSLSVLGGVIKNNTGWGYQEGSSAARNVISPGVRFRGNTAGQISRNASSLTTIVAHGVLDYTPNSGTNGDIIASATTITLPSGGEFFAVTGTTTVTTINGGFRGRQVTLKFTGILTVTHSASNIRLAGGSNRTTASGNQLTLRYDGSVWSEVAFSTAT